MESEALSESPWRHLSSDTFDELLFHMEGFVASETFAGARAGRVFKMGELGLGYYKDTWKPRIECLALSSTCKELRLLLLPNFIPQATSMAAAAAAIPCGCVPTYHLLHPWVVTRAFRGGFGGAARRLLSSELSSSVWLNSADFWCCARGRPSRGCASS